MNTVNNQVPEDYMLYGIKPEYQSEVNVLLATTGVLNSVSGMHTLIISNCTVETGVHSTMNTQRFVYQATVVNMNEQQVKIMKAQGVPNQCFEYFCHKFSQVLKKHQDTIYIKQHNPMTLNELLR
ncbi:hypothetical protein [Colwellia sp. BRX8-9]|uniref:hypothetical protein n=1 Tax=Colwellia sp. BRX8-9 TaxID=2759831 RepID=UPI0015F3EC37|nr:hypothetical protein [Colwellia sp. BRX8-9]MBA6350053.1 hypothetical protein [Colwellia sp. BRX8-9]